MELLSEKFFDFYSNTTWKNIFWDTDEDANAGTGFWLKNDYTNPDGQVNYCWWWNIHPDTYCYKDYYFNEHGFRPVVYVNTNLITF